MRFAVIARLYVVGNRLFVRQTLQWCFEGWEEGYGLGKVMPWMALRLEDEDCGTVDVVEAEKSK